LSLVDVADDENLFASGPSRQCDTTMLMMNDNGADKMTVIQIAPPPKKKALVTPF
jgi:hypothetical protein